jgi:glyoxylase-like metal-dependent hydrolase (beta-lactamase superfamily II)
MILKTLTVGSLATNCYIIGCEKTHAGAIIDPGGEASRIISEASAGSLEIQYIINTHVHIDHIQANEELRKTFSCPLCVHEKDDSSYGNPDLNLSAPVLCSPLTFPSADRKLRERDEIKVGELSLSILHTPGHTPGSISIIVERDVFTGDALFAGGIGRTDLPGGDHDLLMQSIKEKLLTLPDDFLIHPGHGPSSTIGTEKKGER